MLYAIVGLIAFGIGVLLSDFVRGIHYGGSLVLRDSGERYAVEMHFEEPAAKIAEYHTINVRIIRK